MSSHDTVWLPCPVCGNLVSFQSKAGECMSNDYRIQDVPSRVAGDIDGDEETCDDCGKLLKVTVQTIITVNIAR